MKCKIRFAGYLSFVVITSFTLTWFLHGGCNGGGDDGNGGGPTYIQPEGTACVSFYVDDSENATYEDGQIQWKGSFQYDETTNVITYDVNWGEQLDYPLYPALYDDGPIADGGHEMRGAVAGDSIFSVEVYVYPEEEDRTYYYGATNEFGYWIWEGPNGEFTVTQGDADSTKCIEAEGMTIHKFGDRDLMILLDTNNLHEDYSETAIDKVYLKGSMNSWTPVQLLDNGSGEDEVGGDGIYTYLQSRHLGPHDGMLYVGQHVQFVFVFNYSDGLEYKISESGFQKAAGEGVSAFSDAWTIGEMEPETITWELDSWGSTYNTMVIIGDDDATGDAPHIDYIYPTSGSTEGGDEVWVYGSNFMSGAKVKFDVAQATTTTFVDSETLVAITPAHSEGVVDVTVTNPNNLSDTLEDAFTYRSESVNLPDWGDLQWPPSTETDAGVPTEYIYGQVYEPGVTPGEGAGAGIIAELGYGPYGSDPMVDSGWQFFSAVYNTDHGNNDEYRATLTVNTPGTYSYTYRYSVDGGLNYLYVDFDPGTGLGNDYDPSNLGTLTVH